VRNIKEGNRKPRKPLRRRTNRKKGHASILIYMAERAEVAENQQPGKREGGKAEGRRRYGKRNTP
jgi:hypothetical protein